MKIVEKETGEKQISDEKISYEKLKTIVDQLQQQNKFLTEKLMEKESMMMFKRLDYLLMTLNKYELFDKDFIETAVKEVQSALYQPEEN